MSWSWLRIKMAWARILFPKTPFWPAHNKCMKAFENEGVIFDEVKIDRSFPADNASTRKPRTGMLTEYIEGDYDLANSFVIGDRITDVELAKNLGAQAIFIQNQEGLGAEELANKVEDLQSTITLTTTDWEEIYNLVSRGSRTASVKRTTKETDIDIEVELDGTGKADVNTGIKFFDHMLDQIAKHGLLDLKIHVKGDLEVDEHHTIEDTGIALGEAINEALGNKKGIERYGFCLPMDDCICQVAIDFGGRNWIEWSAEFKRENGG